MAMYRVDYDLSFQGVAQRLFELASNRLVHGLAVTEKGSYSFRPTNRSQETVVKILIFQRALGIQMQGELPWCGGAPSPVFRSYAFRFRFL